MARFAAEAKEALKTVVQGLYTELGPDTADLSMRFGLRKNLYLVSSSTFVLSATRNSHTLCCLPPSQTDSGPVTAGVLMGDRARFQVSLGRVMLCTRTVWLSRDELRVAQLKYALFPALW